MGTYAICLPENRINHPHNHILLSKSHLFKKFEITFILNILIPHCVFITELSNGLYVTPPAQNAMPLSSAIFKSEHKNPVPQCPPRLDVQTINAVLWSRMPNTFLKVETARVSERHGWSVQCVEPLQMMAVHIPEENRYLFIIFYLTTAVSG